MCLVLSDFSIDPMTVTTHLSFTRSHTLNGRGLTCIRGDRTLFEDLNLHIAAGECLHVRGENGIGKTSLLRLLAGLSAPEVGEVLFADQSIYTATEQYRQNLLFLGHRDALKDDLTALENVTMYALLDNVPLKDDQALANLWRFGLRGREDLPVSCLSAGQKKRVLMARMVARQAQVWILDEPFNALDANACMVLQDLISEHGAQGGITVLTSHQMLGIPNIQVLEL
jgi:heme exporter protein A